MSEITTTKIPLEESGPEIRQGRPPGTGIFHTPRVIKELKKDPLQYLTQLHEKYGDIAQFKVGPYRIFLLNHPDYIKQVLQSNHQNYVKSTMYRFLRPALGNGLVTAEGEFWKKQRRLMQPAFQPSHISKFMNLFAKETGTFIDSWGQAADEQRVLDGAAEMNKLAFQIIGQAICGTDVSSTAQNMSQAMETSMTEIMHRITSLFRVPDFIPTSRNVRFSNAINIMKTIVNDIISARRKDGPRGDLLDVLLAARDEETNEGMSDEQLRDEVMTLLTAGHETSANLMSWTLYLLSQNRNALECLREEYRVVLGGRYPDYEDLARLPYTQMVLEETMRIYPPVWEIERGALKDDRIGGYKIPAGSIVTMSQYVMHRSPKYWEAPEKFDPERFSPERSEGRNRFVYFPFGGGPRICIGNHFSMAEATVILSGLLQNLDIELIQSEPPVPEPLITLRPKGGLALRFKRLN